MINHFVLFWPILLFSPCWRRWKNTWEACFTTENLKTWREGMNENNLASFLSMHFVCHSLEELVSYFPYKLNCTIYFYASLSYMPCDKAGNERVLFNVKNLRQMMWKKALLYFLDCSEIKLKNMFFKSWHFHAWFLGSTRILLLTELWPLVFSFLKCFLEVFNDVETIVDLLSHFEKTAIWDVKSASTCGCLVLCHPGPVVWLRDLTIVDGVFLLISLVLFATFGSRRRELRGIQISSW